MKKSRNIFIVICLIIGSYFSVNSFFVGQKQPFIAQPKVPGAINSDITQENINQTLCNAHWSTKSIRPATSYTNKLKVAQIKEYGYLDAIPGDYEEDHLISLQLGGNPTDPNNLWPQPIMEARQKDLVENYLHKQLCNGKITLKSAQNTIVSSWYETYQSITKNLGANEYSDNDPDDY